mmetsp:Transcript_11272/g.25868  ORF Transcript_11272/g.25868 Transcript_11272/m.25868 type:complete len:102 (-) Transcript_11272:92-397(-)
MQRCKTASSRSAFEHFAAATLSTRPASRSGCRRPGPLGARCAGSMLPLVARSCRLFSSGWRHHRIAEMIVYISLSCMALSPCVLSQVNPQQHSSNVLPLEV